MSMHGENDMAIIRLYEVFFNHWKFICIFEQWDDFINHKWIKNIRLEIFLPKIKFILLSL